MKKTALTGFTAGMALMLKYQRMRLTFDELATELGLSVGTLYNLHSADALPVPTYKEGAKRYCDVRDLGEYLDKKRTEAVEAFTLCA